MEVRTAYLTLADESQAIRGRKAPYYDYYGLSPYSGAGYMYPDFPISGRTKTVSD